MDVVITDFIHCKQYNFKAAEDPEFKRILDIARRLPPAYKPPSAYHAGWTLLNHLHDLNWDQLRHD
jgi:hypothetical protein